MMTEEKALKQLDWHQRRFLEIKKDNEISKNTDYWLGFHSGTINTLKVILELDF